MSVVIGVDPHKASHTAVVRCNQHEKVLGRWRVQASSSTTIWHLRGCNARDRCGEPVGLLRGPVNSRPDRPCGVTVINVTRRKTPQEERLRRYLAVVAANEKHARSTTQRDDAAAELGLTVSEFVATLDDARRMGLDTDRYPPKA
jgi:hypothetical protein